MDRGKRAKVKKTYVTANGTLYKDAIVRVENVSDPYTRVRDDLGKIFHVNTKDIVYIKF